MYIVGCGHSQQNTNSFPQCMCVCSICKTNIYTEHALRIITNQSRHPVCYADTTGGQGIEMRRL